MIGHSLRTVIMTFGNNHTLTPSHSTNIESCVGSSFLHEKTLRKVKIQDNENSMKENEKGRHKRLKRGPKGTQKNGRLAILIGMEVPLL